MAFYIDICSLMSRGSMSNAPSAWSLLPVITRHTADGVGTAKENPPLRGAADQSVHYTLHEILDCRDALVYSATQVAVFDGPS